MNGLSAPEDLPEHGVTVVFIELDNTKIELLYPFGEKSPIAGFLKKNANGGMHHICIEVNDIKAAMQDLKAKNIQLLSEEPRIGAHGKPVRLLLSKTILFCEWHSHGPYSTLLFGSHWPVFRPF